MNKNLIAGAFVMMSVMIGTNDANAGTSYRKVNPQTVADKMSLAYHNMLLRTRGDYRSLNLYCKTRNRHKFYCTVKVTNESQTTESYEVIAIAKAGYHRTKIFEDFSGWIKITPRTYLVVARNDTV